MNKQIACALCALIALVSSAVPIKAASGTPINPDPREASANPRLVRITQGPEKGTILASIAPGAIYRSTDEGATFSKVTDIAYPPSVVWDCCGVLYEVPRTVGAIQAGTILFSGDYCEEGAMSTNIYASTDDGNTWTFLAAPVRGGKCARDANGVYRGVQGYGLWEPDFEVSSDGVLVMFWSDETDPCCSQKLSQIRTYDGVTWQDQKNTVASTNHNDRPGMAVVTQIPSGKYFMTYELCQPEFSRCDVTYRTSDDGWNFGPPADIGTKIATAAGLYFQHAPRNIWYQSAGSGKGELVVVGQMLYQQDGAVSAQNGGVLFVNPSKDGSGPWTTIPAPVDVPNAGLPAYTTCPNYSSALLPVKGGTSLLEMASDTNILGRCQSSYATEPLQSPSPVSEAFLSGSIVGKSGSPNQRVWTLEVANGASHAVSGTEVTGVALQQTRGAACTPTFPAHQFPLPVGDLQSGATVQIRMLIDFSGCNLTATFTVTVTETANNGAVTGSFQRLNQFQ
jgi:hypothetical protein